MKKVLYLFLALFLFGSIGINFSDSSEKIAGKLEIMEASAFANCLGGAHPGKKQVQGSQCWCEATGDFVTEQSCSGKGSGCSEVDCEQSPQN